MPEMMNPLQSGRTRLIVGLLLLSWLGWETVEWTVNRIYVPPEYSLRLRYKGPLIFGSRKMAAAGQLASDDEIGVRTRLLGPGRHFYCPLWWETTLGAPFPARMVSRQGVRSNVRTPLSGLR